MPTEAVFAIKLEPELRDTFMAEAAADNRPAAQVVREMMRDYIACRKHEREYTEFVRRKVERARAQRDAGQYASNEEVEASAEVRRSGRTGHGVPKEDTEVEAEGANREEVDAEYDVWFRRKVEAGLAEANAGDLIPAAEVEAKFATRREATRRRLETKSVPKATYTHPHMPVIHMETAVELLGQEIAKRAAERETLMKEAEARGVDASRIALLTAEMTALRGRQGRLRTNDHAAIRAVLDQFGSGCRD